MLFIIIAWLTTSGNRQQAGLLIRNCQLVLLCRGDDEEQERDVFQPAEWRCGSGHWSVPQL